MRERRIIRRGSYGDIASITPELVACDHEEIYPARVKSTDIIAYRSYLIAEGKSTNTIALTLVALRHFYRSNIDLVTENPTVKIKPPKALRNSQTRLTYCNLEQLDKLLSQVELTTKSDPLDDRDPETTVIYAHVLDRYENNPASRIDVKIEN